MKIPILHLPDEARRPFFRGMLLGSALTLALCAVGIGAWRGIPAQEANEPYAAQRPFDPAQLAPQSLNLLAGRPPAQSSGAQTGQVQTAQPIQATPIGSAAGSVQTAAASPQSPIPLPNVPNVPVVLQAAQQIAPPQQAVQPLVQAQPQAAPMPAAAAPAREDAIIRSGETFSDGRIAYFGGMEVPHEKTGENYGT